MITWTAWRDINILLYLLKLQCHCFSSWMGRDILSSRLTNDALFFLFLFISFYRRLSHSALYSTAKSGWELEKHNVLILFTRMYYHRRKVGFVNGIWEPLGFQACTSMLLINSTHFASDAINVVRGVELQHQSRGPVCVSLTGLSAWLHA